MTGLGTAALAAVAGCTAFGSGDEANDGDTSGDGQGSDDTELSGDSNDESAPTFEYTFQSDDDVVESSLTGVRVNYPDGLEVLSDASVASEALGGTDVSDDLDGTSTSNNGTSMRLDFGGSYDIRADETLLVELSGVNAPEGSYMVEVVVNPQSGETTFERSF